MEHANFLVAGGESPLQYGPNFWIDARFLFKVWATGQRKIGECAIVFQSSVYMLSLSFLVSALSFSNQNPCVTNPMSILYILPMTDKKPHICLRDSRGQE